MCWNWCVAVRMTATLFRLAIDLTRIAKGGQHFGDRVQLTAWFNARKAVASFSLALRDPKQRAPGSPMVAGSTKPRRSSELSVGSAAQASGRPAPSRRTRTGVEDAASRSFAPRMIVLRATPVARQTAAVPP